MRQPSPAGTRLRELRPRRPAIGLGLLAFGISGLLLIAAAAALLLGSLSAIGDAATGFERQRTQVLAMVGPASDALDGAARSASNVGASLSETSTAAGRAAVLTTSLATSFEGLAALGTFEVLGSRPFLQLAGEFGAVAVEARALSEDLSAAATALATNISDSEAVAADLRVLADQLNVLEESLGGSTASPAGSPTPGASVGPAAPASSSALPLDIARFVVAGLLVWLSIPAFASIWLGLRFLRAPRAS